MNLGAFAAFGPVVLAACNGTQPAAENMPVETPVLGVQTPEALAPKIETRAPVGPVEKVTTRILEKTPVVQKVVQPVPQRVTAVIRLANDNHLLSLTRKGAVKGCEGKYLACFRKHENRLFFGKGNVSIIVPGIGRYIVRSWLGWRPSSKIGRERIGNPYGHAIHKKADSLNP